MPKFAGSHFKRHLKKNQKEDNEEIYLLAKP